MDKLEIKQGSFIQQTQYFIPDSRSGGNQCFSRPNWVLPDLSVGPACLGISESVHITTKVVSSNPVHQFGAKFKLVFCAKYDRGLDLGFWEILKPLKWAHITSFFLIKTNCWKYPLKFYFSLNLNKILCFIYIKKKFYKMFTSKQTCFNKQCSEKYIYQNKLWTNWRSSRALLYNKPSILYRTVGPVETNVFPDRIEFYRICPSDRHVWESLNQCISPLKL
jgi:hypothetical protein